MNLLWCIVKGVAYVVAVLGIAAIFIIPPMILVMWAERKWDEKAGLCCLVLVMALELGILLGIWRCYG